MSINSPVAHSLYDRDGVEICLFTKDPQEDYRKKLEEQPVRRVTKVISITKLKKNYHQYADR
jgi:ribosome biogenesis protein UTP30